MANLKIRSDLEMAVQWIITSSWWPSWQAGCHIRAALKSLFSAVNFFAAIFNFRQFGLEVAEPGA
jgi:hypothetical protein